MGAARDNNKKNLSDSLRVTAGGGKTVYSLTSPDSDFPHLTAAACRASHENSHTRSVTHTNTHSVSEPLARAAVFLDGQQRDVVCGRKLVSHCE